MTAADFVPPGPASLDELRRAATRCQGCDLYLRATGTVFGDGPGRARLVMVGEQPGDQEDRKGAPFVGPAGRVLDRALAQAGLDRAEVYVTNAVKHFNWEPSGARRLHKKPNRHQVTACRPWLSAELATIKPEVVCCLGATAAESVFGRAVKVNELRGRLLPPVTVGATAVPVLVTVHPSSVLRGPPETREEALTRMVADLAVLGSSVAGLRPK